MEAVGIESKRDDEPTKAKKFALLLLNCAFLALGNSGGPLLLRLYFIRGGTRLWFSSWLQTGGWPILLIPLSVSFFYRRSSTADDTKLFFITPRLFMASSFLGLLLGLDDYIYAYGPSYLPITTSSLLISTQLVFNALFSFFVVKQKFSSYSINFLFLLTLGALVLGFHTSGDRPANESHFHYMLGFFLTLGAAVLYGIILPLLQLAYVKAKEEITYSLVIEVQTVMSFFATAFCTVGMLINNDFQAIAREVRAYELGEVKYYVVVLSSAIMWQFYFLGMVGVVSCSSSLHAGVLEAALLPVTQILAVLFFHEKFTAEKGVSLALSLWGFSSYLYGEKLKEKKKFVKETDLVYSWWTYGACSLLFKFIQFLYLLPMLLHGSKRKG